MLAIIFSPLGAINRKQYILGFIYTIIFAIIIGIIASIIVMLLVGSKAAKPENYQANMQNLAAMDQNKAQVESVLGTPNPTPEEVANAQKSANVLQTETETNPIFKMYASETMYVSIAIALLLLWCNLCLIIKRLRDTSISPLLVALPAAAIICLHLPIAQRPIVQLGCLIIIAGMVLLCMFYPSRVAKN